MKLNSKDHQIKLKAVLLPDHKEILSSDYLKLINTNLNWFPIMKSIPASFKDLLSWLKSYQISDTSDMLISV